MLKYAVFGLFALAGCSLFGQGGPVTASDPTTWPTPPTNAPATPGGLRQREPQQPPASGSYTVPPGTRVLMNMINSVSTKQAQVGDRIYLETAFPISATNHIVVPQGSWVTGTIIEVKRPGRVKGRGELQVRFDSLTLPNGVSRSFRSDLSQVDGRSNQDLNREQSKIKGPSDKMGDATTVMTTTAEGAGIGAAVGAAAGHIGAGAGLGAGAGAAAGLATVLLSRGPDATLTKGSSVEMTLDRPLTFEQSDLDFSKVPPRATLTEGSPPPTPQRRTLGFPFPL